jgi:hypothetical protein
LLFGWSQAKESVVNLLINLEFFEDLSFFLDWTQNSRRWSFLNL